MPTRNQSHILIYRARHLISGALVGSDVGNHTLRWSKDGAAAAAPANAPSARATSGEYQVVLTASEADCEIGTLTGTSSTANVELERVDVAYQVGVALTSAGLTAVRADGLNVNLLTGQTVGLTPAAQSALVVAIEAALINDADGQALRDAILATINDALDLPELQITAIATACRDAILNRVLAGNHATAGTVGGQLLKINELLLAADYTDPDNDGIDSALEAATAAAAGVVTLQSRLTSTRAGYLDDIPNLATSAELEGIDVGNVTVNDFGGTALSQLRALPAVASTPIVNETLITLVAGDDYFAVDGRSITISDETSQWPDIAGATVELHIKSGSTVETFEGEADTDGEFPSVVFELDRDGTNLTPGWYDYQIVATLAGTEHVVTLQIGKLKVLKRIAA